MKEVGKGEKGWEWRQFHPKQRKSLSTTLQQAMNFCSLAQTSWHNSQCRWGQRQGMRNKRRETMLPFYHTPPSLQNSFTVSRHRKMVFMQELKMPSQHQLFANTQFSLSWFNLSRQLSTTQPLAHSPHPVGWGRESKKSKTHGLR